jgi:RNA polymerase sigma-70 factor (ECF subfamily)
MTNDMSQRVETLVQQLAPDLLAYFARRLSPAGDAADLLSETFVVICRRARDVPADDAEARLWAFGVARKVLSSHRRTGRRRTALVERLRCELNQSETDTHDESSSDRLHVALSKLKPIDQEIMRLVHWDGFSQAEVASIVGKPAATVRSRYTRARTTLRANLAHDQEPEHDPAAPSGHCAAPAR